MTSSEKNISFESSGKTSDCERLVIFMGGFDPRGARHYHQLMRAESQKQPSVSEDRKYAIGSREKWNESEAAQEKSLHSQWRVSQTDSENTTSADFVFFDWHDQVRLHWPSSRAEVFRQAVGTYVSIWNLRQWLKPVREQARFTLWALMYPLFYMLLVLLAGLGMGSMLVSAWDGLPPVAAAVLMMAAVAVVGWGGLVLDGYLHISWLLRILNFAHASSGKTFPVLDARIEAMAAEVAQAMQQQRWREVVVVGFSVGSVQALKLTQALRRKLAEDPLSSHASRKPLVSLVTLGNCIPLFGLFPGAGALRQTLREVAMDEAVYWADISSPSDSVCFGMCDVVGLSLREDGRKDEASAVNSVADSSKRRPQWGFNPQAICSPRFHKLFLPTTYRWLRRNKMRMHFQYLMAGEVAGAYDYFELLTSAGPMRDYIERKLVR
ncbi:MULTISPECIES: hypothetical protein [Comamonas]|uniref:hypothetical protein n=1 Tax=Comamonas TaxID=283 RepID=UPI00055005FB|nr:MULTISPECIES: hypothetical protein [Comamonas]TFF59044.1 hypothetical protein EIC84_14515 [Comamonas sp. A23]